MAEVRTRQPEWSMRIGSVKGAIWKNSANDKTFYKLSLVRSYQNEQGDWVDSSSFSLIDVLAAQMILEKAAQKLAELNA